MQENIHTDSSIKIILIHNWWKDNQNKELSCSVLITNNLHNCSRRNHLHLGSSRSLQHLVYTGNDRQTSAGRLHSTTTSSGVSWTGRILPQWKSVYVSHVLRCKKKSTKNNNRRQTQHVSILLLWCHLSVQFVPKHQH